MNEITPRFLGVVQDGNIRVLDSTSFREYLRSLPSEIEIVVRPRTSRKDRSNSQNKYFHGPVLDALVNLFNEEFGYTRDETKEIVKYKFLRDYKEIKNKDGSTEIMEYVKPTSSLTTVEFEKFMEEVRMWASQLGCDIKEPNEQD